MINIFKDPEAITTARERAEQNQNDSELLELRELEVAASDLPTVIDGVRRTRLLLADGLATTWEGWDIQTGQRVLIRCARPRWRTDSVMLRRLSVGADLKSSETLIAPTWHPDGDWPHLRAVVPHALLNDYLPVEDPADPLTLAKIMAGGLVALAAAHKKGVMFGPSLPSLLVVDGPTGMLINMDSFACKTDEAGDIVELAKAIIALDPAGDHPITTMAAGWTVVPPPTATDGLTLLYKTMGQTLLSTAMAPPKGTACVKVSNNGVSTLIHSDGQSIFGGQSQNLDTTALNEVYSHSSGLNASASRALLRAWALKDSGDETKRISVNQQLSTISEDNNDDLAANFVRWLSAMNRLRAAKLLIAAGSANIRSIG